MPKVSKFMLTLLKFNTECKFFQYDVINIPDFNVLQRKIPVQIVWLCSGCWKWGTSSACFVMFSYFLVTVLILSIAGRGAPVYLPATRGQTFQSATNTGKIPLWAQSKVRDRQREDGEEICWLGARDAEPQGQSQPGEAPSWELGQDWKGTRWPSLVWLGTNFPRFGFWSFPFRREDLKSTSATKWCSKQCSIFVAPQFTGRNKPQHCRAD